MKVALVTGASGGIGLSIGSELHRTGWKIIGLARNSVSRLTDWDGALAADLTEPGSAENIIKKSCGLYGRLDAVIHCAGTASRYGSLEMQERRNWKEVLDLNLIATSELAQASLAPLVESMGAFIFLSTNAIRFHSPHSLPYTSSKLAAEHVLTSTFMPHFNKGVRFHIIRPGVIDSGMAENVGGYTIADWNKRVALIPKGRAGQPEEIACLVRFLLSHEASFMNNTIIPVTGGEN